MSELDKLRVLLPHWIEHNAEHAAEFRQWAERAGPAQAMIQEAAASMEQANQFLQQARKAIESAS
jgi:hypothetical protein